MKQLVCVVAVLMVVGSVRAESITHGGTTVTIDFAGIGYAGNVADSSGYGAVDYDYKIGVHELTIAQFEAVRSADTRVGDGNEGYWNVGARTVGSGGPATYISWYEAAKLSNWLTTGDAYAGAYQFDSNGTLLAVDRDAAVIAYGTVYVMPSEDEWYKAAYYKPVHDGTYSLYSSGLDSIPIHGSTNGWNYYNNGPANVPPNVMWETGFGAKEQNGTYDMMGNVGEWTESASDRNLDDLTERRVIRGGNAGHRSYSLRSKGSFNSSRFSGDPATRGNDYLGFRVAAIPEPQSLAMIGLVSAGFIFIRRRFAG